jgi:flagellin-like protein
MCFVCMKKRGVSPVIATIILIAIVIILAIIIFLWARGFVAEKAQKFGRAVDFSCQDVNFEAGIAQIPSCSSYNLDIVNRGDVPIYGFEVKDISNPGDVLLKSTLTRTITVGQSTTDCLDAGGIEIDGISTADKLLVVPIILGESDSGKVAHTCADNFGFEAKVP